MAGEVGENLTLVELAKILDVSAATISRALNRPEMVSPAMRERVLDAVERYNYRPNGVARSLRRGETRTVGLVVSDIKNSFYSSIVQAVEDALSEHGYSVVVCDANESREKEQRALALLAELKLDGIIHAFSGSDLSELNRLGLGSIPLVEIDRASRMKGAGTVLLDNRLGSRLAVEHLLELGHVRIGMISGSERLTTGRERVEGYRLALEAAGVSFDSSLVGFGDFQERSGYDLAKRLLARAERPTALLVANNEMMAGALTALRQLGLRLPDELSVICFDDARWATHVDPPLTVVAQPLEEMGRTAATLLLEQIAATGRPGAAGREPRVRVFPPELIVRRSTSRPGRPRKGR